MFRTEVKVNELDMFIAELIVCEPGICCGFSYVAARNMFGSRCQPLLVVMGLGCPFPVSPMTRQDLPSPRTH